MSVGDMGLVTLVLLLVGATAPPGLLWWYRLAARKAEELDGKYGLEEEEVPTDGRRFLGPVKIVAVREPE